VHEVVHHRAGAGQLVQCLLGAFMVAPMCVRQEVGQRRGLYWHKHPVVRRDAVDDPPLIPFLVVEHLLLQDLQDRVSGMFVAEIVEHGEGGS
jgi:hypothetical protein